MSFITTANSGSPAQPYAIQNIGTADRPCIKAGVLSATPGVSDTVVRVGSDVSGMILTGGGGSVIPLVRGINGGTANTTNGEQVLLGASAASFQNIVLTDGLTTINGDMVLSGAGSDLNVGGNIVLVNGLSAGKSISGYYSVSTAVAGAGAQANPAGLTAGVYNVLYVPTGGAVGQAPSGVFIWSGSQWFGNAIGANFTAGVPDIAILPTAGNATLTIGGGAPSVPGALYWRKLLN